MGGPWIGFRDLAELLVQILGVVGQIWDFCRRIIRGEQDVDSPSCRVRGVFEFVGVAGHVSRRLFWAIKSVSTRRDVEASFCGAWQPAGLRSDRISSLLGHFSTIPLQTSFTRRKQLQRASSAVASLNSTPQLRSASFLVELLDFPK